MKIVQSAVLFIFANVSCFGQSTYVTDASHEADCKIYLTQSKSSANLILYVSNYKYLADPDTGVLYYEKHKSNADWVVKIVDHKSEADCLIFITRYRHLATRNDCFPKGIRQKGKRIRE